MNESEDVPLQYPHVQRRNWQHRSRVLAAMHELGFGDYELPYDFHRRHWRDQRNFFELVLAVSYCNRCKVPVAQLKGMLCADCQLSNDKAWEEKRGYTTRSPSSIRTEIERRQHIPLIEPPPTPAITVDEIMAKYRGDK